MENDIKSEEYLKLYINALLCRSITESSYMTFLLLQCLSNTIVLNINCIILNLPNISLLYI